MLRLKKIATGTTGSEIAEAALVLPIFFLIMLGIYWFGRAFNTYATINHAAREGATCGRCADLRHLWQPQHLTDHESDCRPSQAVPPGFQPRSESGHKLSGKCRTACGGGTASCQTPSCGNLRFASTTTCNYSLPPVCPPAPAHPLVGFRFSSNIPINSPFHSLLSTCRKSC